MGQFLSTNQEGIIHNALRIAAEQFEGYVKLWNDAVPAAEAAEEAGGHPVVTSRGAKLLAEQFNRQAKDARELLDLIENFDAIELHA